MYALWLVVCFLLLSENIYSLLSSSMKLAPGGYNSTFRSVCSDRLQSILITTQKRIFTSGVTANSLYLSFSPYKATNPHINLDNFLKKHLTLTLLNATECTNSKKLLQIVALSRQGIFATWILLRNSRILHCILLHLAWFMFRNTAFCCI